MGSELLLLLLLLEEKLALGGAEALDLARLDLGAAEDLAAAEVGVELLALALQLALQDVHGSAETRRRRRQRVAEDSVEKVAEAALGRRVVWLLNFQEAEAAGSGRFVISRPSR